MESWNKPCELEDFADAEVRDAMRAIFPEQAVTWPEWPNGHEDRKNWEISMAVLSMRRFLDPGRRQFALGIGAGTEATSFYLTQFFRWVFATDMYGSENWPLDSPEEMLYCPERHYAGRPFVRNHLVVQHMDARDIKHENGTFDFIYSSGSIEHFGSPDDIKRAAREMGRVLKPEGIIGISTEYCIQGRPGFLHTDTLLLSPEDLLDLIIGPSNCEPVDTPLYSVSDMTLAHKVPYNEALRDRARTQHGRQHAWSRYPHIVMEREGRAWTSYHLTLRTRR